MHYNYLFMGNKRCDLTLLNAAVYPKIMDTVAPVLRRTDVKKGKISIIQYANRKQVKAGRPRWDRGSLSPVLQNCEQYDDSFHFTHITAEFPSIAAAYKRGDSVEVYLDVENDSPYGRRKSVGGCGLFLSLREDVFTTVGETVVTDVLRSLYSLFDEMKLLFRKRRWWAYAEDVVVDGGVIHAPLKNEESALQDISAARYRDKLYAKNYTNWVEMGME
jgi:hypothetical protein